MRTGTLTFNGVNSLDRGVYISGSGAHNAAEADTTSYQIPGRNGDLVISNNRWKNIEVVYPAFIPHGFAAKEQGVRNWLRSAVNYKLLTDSYDPDHFRFGRPIGEIEFTPVRPDGANFEIVFDCMPQRFLVSGGTAQTIEDSITLNNPTQFEARPVLEVQGVADGLEIEFTDSDGRTVTFTATDDHAGFVEIDCETMDIYDGDTHQNLNSLFTISGEFPTLKPGANIINFAGTYTSANILPRWWEL